MALRGDFNSIQGSPLVRLGLFPRQILKSLALASPSRHCAIVAAGFVGAFFRPHNSLSRSLLRSRGARFLAMLSWRHKTLCGTGPGVLKHPASCDTEALLRMPRTDTRALPVLAVSPTSCFRQGGVSRPTKESDMGPHMPDERVPCDARRDLLDCTANSEEDRALI